MSMNKWLGCLALGGLVLSAGSCAAVDNNNRIHVTATAPAIVDINFGAGNNALALTEANGNAPAQVPVVVSDATPALAQALNVTVASANGEGAAFRLQDQANAGAFVEYTVKVARDAAAAQADGTAPAQHGVAVVLGQVAGVDAQGTVAVSAQLTNEQRAALVGGHNYADTLTVNVTARA